MSWLILILIRNSRVEHLWYIPHTCISITLGDLGKALFDCSSVCMSFAFGMALFKPLLYVSVGGHRWARGGRVLHPQASILDDPFVMLRC